MKLILSRKGFDSSAGGCPNPQFPDGGLLALPIPDQRSRIAYGDLHHGDVNVGDLVEQLTKRGVRANHGAHLDPDMTPGHYQRSQGWRPVLGQTGSAQGHLRKQAVGIGDVFLYFGLFREIEQIEEGWRFKPGAPPKHVLWGWMQIAQVLKVDELDLQNEHRWLSYHPHCHGEDDDNNTIYVSANRLKINGRTTQLPGYGVFAGAAKKQILTDPAARSPSFWRLPRWFFPDNGQPPLSYHAKPERWSRDARHCFLRSAARGQEFVLNTQYYPDAIRWLKGLVNSSF